MTSSVPQMFTVQEVAELFGVHPQTVRAWIRQRKLGSHKIGRYDRISEDQVARFLKEHLRGNGD